MVARLLALTVALACLAARAEPAPPAGAAPPALPSLGAVAAPAKPRPAQPEVTVTAAPSKGRVAPGEQLAIAVVFEFAEGWHAWPHEPALPKELADVSPIPTTIAVDPAPAWLSAVGLPQWPRTHEVEVNYGEKPVRIPSYSGRAVAYVPVVVSPAAVAGPQAMQVIVGYQACNEVMCMAPAKAVLPVSVEVVPAAQLAGTDASPADPALFADFDLGSFARIGKGEDIVEFNVFGLRFKVDAAGFLGTSVLVLLAALGGLLLNLTPCVLPVIPIKIMGLSQAASNPARALTLGIIMSAGVVAFWLAIGGAIAFVAGFKQINTLFQQPWFSLVVGAVIAVMGVGMLGVFTVSLPKAVYMVNPSHESPQGSFLFGIMTAVLSTPCTAPFMGTAAAWATKQPPWLTMATFASIGAGMALPYLILSANPGLVSKVPRTGPASELVKQVMGLLMMGVAAFFLGVGFVAVVTKAPDPPSKAYWWIVAACVAFAGVWLAWRTIKITPRFARRALFGGVGLALAAGSVAIAADLTRKGPIPWVYYTPARFDEASKRGDVIVLDFTAEWCLNCKTLEATVLHTRDIVDLLKSPGVTPMKIDLTGDNPDGSARLKSLNWVGIPLLAVFGPGAPEPIKHDAYTPQMVKDAVAKARGK